MRYPLLYSPLQPLLRTAFERGPSGLDQQIAQLFRAGEMGVWYDPSDMSTMWQDAAQTTRAVIGSPVGYISDKSGNGFAATQSTAGSRPTLQQTNGLNYLLFDGVDDFMVTSAINFTATDKMTTWSGVRRLSDAAPGDVVCLGTGSTVGGFRVTTPFAGADPRTICVSAGTVAAAATTSGGAAAPASQVTTTQMDIAAPVITIRRNGTQEATNAGAQGTGAYANAVITVGARNGGASAFLNGNVYSIIVRGAASTAAQVTTAETYVNQKTAAF